MAAAPSDSVAAKDYYQNIEKQWAEEYPSTSSVDKVWEFYKECGYENPEKTLSSILDKVQWEQNSVLDFGCDTGFMLDFICKSKESNLSGVGVDINKAAIAEASKNFPQYQFDSFDGITLPYEDNSFDLVFASAVIKHVRYEDRSKVYAELKRVAKQIFFIDADSKVKEEVKHANWTFYHSHFEEEFKENFTPLFVVHECGDILGLYSCD